MNRHGNKVLARLVAGMIAFAAPAVVQAEQFHRGYLIDEQLLGQVKPGMSAEQVLQVLGTPSTVSTVGNKSWYYISQTTSRPFQFMPERVVDQKVTAVYFNKGLKVERTALYGIQDGKVFDFVSRTTPAGGGEQNFVGQLFRGLGSLLPSTGS